MSTTPFPGPYPTTMAHILVHHITSPAASRRAKSTRQVLRRRPTMQQGRALELLGHAIEYLIDTQLHRSTSAVAPSDVAANHLLMRLSREVFAECREIVPVRRKLKLRLRNLFAAAQTA
jgi:hypothetical protein